MMTSEARPVSPNSFAAAIEDLPVENLYTKAVEINNSVAHLERSNRTLQETQIALRTTKALMPRLGSMGTRTVLRQLGKTRW